MTEAALFYESAAAGLGDDFLDDVQYAIDSVRERPNVGVMVGHGFRRFLLRRFPFSIIYAPEPKQIVVLAVAHQRRAPGYWRRRKPSTR
jgi:toxin ParE1/3/4